MSDLREALRALSNPDGFPLFSHSQVDSVLLVFEAYLREHDAQLDPSSANWRDGWQTRDAENAVVQQEATEAERERARQRIEALDRITSDYDGASGFLATDVFKALADE